MFFVVAAMMLVTAGVFAGKSKFFATYDIFEYNSSVGYHLFLPSTQTFGTTGLSYSTTATPVSISSATATYKLYTGVPGSTYYPVFVQ